MIIPKAKYLDQRSNQHQVRNDPKRQDSTSHFLQLLDLAYLSQVSVDLDSFNRRHLNSLATSTGPHRADSLAPRGQPLCQLW